MTIDQKIEQFLAAAAFAVVGASANRDKFGNKILQCYQQSGRKVTPVHPVEKQIEGLECASSVAELEDGIDSISVVTPPQITEKVVDQSIARGIKNIWMQPGAESAVAVKKAEKNGLNVIADGSCLLVVLNYDHH